MINLRNSPFLWLSFVLLLSIWISGLPGFELTLSAISLLWLTCIACAVLSLVSYSPKYQYRSSLCIGALIFAAGMLRVNEFKKEIFPSDPLSESLFMEGVVMVHQVLKNKETSVSLKCRNISLSFDADSTRQQYNDKFLLANVKTSAPLIFFPGDIIGIKGYVSSIREPLNPYAFDARIYYQTIGIRHMMYCKAEEIQDSFPSENGLSRMTAKWQYFLSALVRKHTRKEVAQLTNALVWGDRSDMDDEVRDAFADSGAMHVLSVSGMHVAIIYTMLLWILGPPGSGSLLQRIFRFGLYSAAILLYVGLAGACPAVVRAGLMIILFLFGKAMGWNTQIWNLLGFAAFMMFWMNPFIWQNIGFQLSFLAMAGILLFAKPMIRSLSFKKVILHRLWEITALSITAQVFILPVLLGQFHQFPLTFIISSFVAIPAAYIVMAGALLNVVLSFAGIDYLWPIVDWSGYVFILVMKWMSGLNPIMFFSLPFTGSLCLMMMAILFSFALVFRWPVGKKIAYVFGCLTILSLGCHRISQWSVRELIVYHSYRGLAMDLVGYGRCVSIHDASLSEQSLEFAARGYRCERDIISVKNIYTNQDFEKVNAGMSHSMLRLPGNNIFLWDGRVDKINESLNLSYIIITACPDIEKLKEFVCQNNDSKIILPAHLDRKVRKTLTAFLAKYAIAFHDIDSEGYFRLEL